MADVLQVTHTLVWLHTGGTYERGDTLQTDHPEAPELLALGVATPTTETEAACRRTTHSD